MSAVVTAMFIRDAKFVRLEDNVAVNVTLDAGPQGGFGGTISLVCRSGDEAQTIIDAATAARDILTGATP